MSFPYALFSVDEQLLWVIRVPESVAGAVRSTALESVTDAREGFDAMAAHLDADEGTALDDLAALAARLALRALADLPDLPYIGEPFGGEDGTD